MSTPSLPRVSILEKLDDRGESPARPAHQQAMAPRPSARGPTSAAARLKDPAMAAMIDKAIGARKAAAPPQPTAAVNPREAASGEPVAAAQPRPPAAAAEERPQAPGQADQEVAQPSQAPLGAAGPVLTSTYAGRLYAAAVLLESLKLARAGSRADPLRNLINDADRYIRQFIRAELAILEDAVAEAWDVDVDDGTLADSEGNA